MCVSCLVMSDSLQLHRLYPHQAPLSMGFSRQDHWSGLPFPSPIGTIVRKKVKSLSRVQLFAIPWTVAYQAPLSMEFSGKSTIEGCHFLLQKKAECRIIDAFELWFSLDSKMTLFKELKSFQHMNPLRTNLQLWIHVYTWLSPFAIHIVNQLYSNIK